jgi:predicted anti-sigma-YlaC factor YlaD
VSSAARPPAAGGRRSRSLLGCEAAQEALSARLDGEWSPVNGLVLDDHLAHCGHCRSYESSASEIKKQTRLRVPTPLADDLLATLIPLLTPVGQNAFPRAFRRARQLRYELTHVRGARWAAAVLPAIVATVAISSGVGSQPHFVPTRPPSPCTEGLVAKQLPSGR